MLKADKVGADGAAGSSNAAIVQDAVSRDKELPGDKKIEKKSDVSGIIEKLKRTAARPHETYLEHLSGYQEVNAEEWSTHFPVGYRERVAPSWLGEVYATGSTGKRFAKDFVRERALGDCNEGRELIPIMAAIDSLLLHDKQPGAINSISLEKLAKKGYGIFVAFQNVEKKSDWKKESNAPKGRTSKVNEELWRRIDPGRAGNDEMAFTSKKLEDEIRGEVDRDANLLKAFAKPQERQRGPAAASSS